MSQPHSNDRANGTAPGAENSLARELRAYHRELPRLLPQEGRFALVHGDQVDSVWDTLDEALAAGHERFGLAPFLVKQIRQSEPPVFVPVPVVGRCPD